MKNKRKKVNESMVRWDTIENYIKHYSLEYDIIDKFVINGYPILIGQQSKTCKLAFLITPSHAGNLLLGDLKTVNNLSEHELFNLMVESKKMIGLKGYDIPLLVCTCRLASTKGSEPVLSLNRFLIL